MGKRRGDLLDHGNVKLDHESYLLGSMRGLGKSLVGLIGVTLNGCSPHKIRSACYESLRASGYIPGTSPLPKAPRPSQIIFSER